MAGAPRRGWATAVAAAVAVHGLLVLIPVMDEREGAAATPSVVRLRLAATSEERAAEAQPAPSKVAPAEPQHTRNTRAEPVAKLREPAPRATEALATEPAEAIPPSPRPAEPHAPAALPDSLVGEPPHAPVSGHAREDDIAAALDAYAAEVREAVEAQKQYPRRARRMRRQGVAEVDVTLTPNGQLSAAPALVQSSGWDSLDREALRMVRAAAPFPRAPETLAAPTITIRLPIRFSIE